MFLKFAAKLRKKNDIHKSVWHILEFLYFFEVGNLEMSGKKSIFAADLGEEFS